MPNLLGYIHYRRTMKRTLIPALNGIRDDDWYVSLGTPLSDGSGVRIGGQDLSWPSPAHEAVWQAARYGFSTQQYQSMLEDHGFPKGQFGIISPGSWLLNSIVDLGSNALLPPPANTGALLDPNRTDIAEWTWHWNWKWVTRPRLGHKICVNPANPHEFVVIPGTWSAIADGLVALPADQSLGAWLFDWSGDHQKLFQKYGHIPVFYALPQLIMLLAALQAYGAGYLDLLHGETLREADERTDSYVQQS